jgi:lipopolysaccharide transport system ATP-binding protein
MGISRTVMVQRFDEIVAFSEIERFIDMPIKVYSSGMYLRLAFATAIHVEADLLLIDEVFAVGDARFQLKCLERIETLQRDGVTMLFVSHSAELVRRLCHQALWIENGRLVACEEADHVVTAYMEQLAFAGAQEKLHKDTHRWGTRAIEIVQVEFLNQDGEVQQRFRTGETVTVRMHYIAQQRVEHPSFGLAIHSSDGAHVNGPNTEFAGFEIRSVQGSGTVECSFAELNLLPGAYEVSVSAYDFTTQQMYDYHHRLHPFWVDANPMLAERYGIVYLPSTWQHRVES